MGSPENGVNNGGLMPLSLLESASLSASLDDNSGLTELQKTLKYSSSSSDPINSELGKPSLSNNPASIGDNQQSNPNQITNYTPSNGIFDNGLSITQPVVAKTTPLLKTSNNNQKSATTQSVDSLTGNTANASLLGISNPTTQISANSASAPLTVQTQQSTSQTSTLPFAIRTDGTISINGGGDFDGVPTDLTDDALIYAAKGFTINGNPTLPVQRNAQGNPIRDANGKLILIDRAVTVASGYTTINGTNNQYANLIPPQVVAQQTITVPAYADIKQVELNRRIPAGIPTVTFNISQNPINNASDWTNKFPPPGTTSNPKVVRVIGGGLNVPANVSLSNYVITVDQGDINFNGNGQNFNNVVLIANNGNINLSNVQSRDLSVFASSSINMNAGARFAGYTTIANGSSGGNITFNGATTSTNTIDNLKVISAGDITYNGASDTRGLFLSVKNFTFNGRSTLYGSISAKGNIIFNGLATVIGVAELMPDITPPVISATLTRDTAPKGQTNQDKITFDPTITGTVTDTNPILEFRAGFNNTPSANYTNVIAQSNSDGSFSFTRSQLETINGGTLTDGIYTLHLQAKDLYGNLSDTFNLTFTLDTTTPIPNNLDLRAIDDSGSSNTDNITNKNTPSITGNAEAGAVVQLFNNGQLLGQATANNTGVWQIVTSNLTDGTYNLTATATDIAGNVSTPSAPLAVSIDSTLPDIKLNTPIDTAPLTPGARLTGSVDGTGSAVTTFSYHFDNLAELTVPFNAKGAFDQSLDLTGLANGAHTLTITATDTAGNIKTTQYHVTVVIDQEAPVISATLVRDTAPGNTTNTDKITFDPSITGTVTDVNQVVSFQAGFNNTNVANFVSVLPTRQSDGSFSFSRPQLEQIYGGTLPDGQHILYLQAADSYSNTSSIFAVAFTLDTITPAPTLKLSTASDSGFNNSSRLTNDATPTINGTAEVGASVQLFNNGQQIGQTTVSADGTWQITTSSLTDGIHSLSAAVTDIAGNTNTSLTSLVVTVDTALPQLTLNTPLDQTPLRQGDKITGSINGTGSSVISLSYRFNNQSEIPIAYNSAEAFDQELDLTGLGNGSHVLTIVAIDAAGNLLTTQYNVTVQLDEAAPVITAALTFDTAPSGTTNSDLITFDPAISGNIVDTSRVVEFRAGFDNTQVANFVDVLQELNSDGTFSFDRSQLAAIYGSSIPDGVHTLHLVAQDEFGNTSNAFSFTFTLDTTVTQPVFNLDAASDSGTVGDKKTKFDTVTLTGLTDPGVTVSDTATDTTVIADNTGKFTFTNVSLVAGVNSFTVKATDIAGNQSIYTSTIYRFSAPTAINLTANSVAENSANGTVIGELSSIDPDTSESHTYILVNDAQGRFKIVGNSLQVADGTLLNYENYSQHTIVVRSTDDQGLSTTQEITVNVTNINEAPSFTSTPIITTIESGSTYTYNITTTDPDAGDSRIITATGVPSWLIFTDKGDGTATLTGTSNQNQLGLFNIAFTVEDAGGLRATQNIILGSQISLTEETNFTATRNLPLVIPATPSILSFKIDKSFDVSDFNAINDAFEVALVDANGNSLVHTITSGRDAFFNLTEGEDVGLGAGASYNSTDQTVRLNLTGVKPGNATLIFRLVNNDSDTTTNVSITEFVLQTAPANTQSPLQSGFGTQPSANTTISPNFNNLTDVSQSFSADYHRTSFNADTHLLYTDIAIHNIGSYSVDAPMIVAVNHISDPTVVVRNPDGFTPEGIPYYNFSNLVADGKLDPNESTTQRSLVFYNPQGMQFSYDLVVLAQLNQAPVIQTQPNKEIIGGQFYSYDVNATDPNGDSLTYKLLASPDGMTIDPTTGLINWNTATSNIGNQIISLEVSDGRGGTVTQDYTLSVIATPPNRPPVFVTNPVVQAYINKQYSYDSNAVDPDNDTVSYSVVIGPDGLVIDPTTGKVQWTAPPALILGDTVIGQVSVAGQNQEFNFAGQAGQRIYFDPIQYSANRGDWKFQVYSPTGHLIVDTYLAYYDNQLITLNEDGNYKIVVDPQGATTGDYGFSVINPTLLPIQPFDKVVNDRLNPGTADRVYRFNATQGQKLYFDYLSRVDGSVDWVLYDPRNIAVAYNGNFDDIEYNVQTSGEYILAVRGKGAFNEVNSFSFNIIDSLLPTSAYTIGSTASGFIQKGEQDSYTFNGTAGQQLFYDTLNTSNYFPITVYDPAGRQIDSFDSRGDRGPDTPLFLSMSGTYKVTVDGYGEATGDYKFRFLDRVAATFVNLDTPVTGIFDSALNNLDAKSYSFVIPAVPVTASPNGKQYVYIDGTGGNAYNRYNIYNESGVNGTKKSRNACVLSSLQLLS